MSNGGVDPPNRRPLSRARSGPSGVGPVRHAPRPGWQCPGMSCRLWRRASKSCAVRSVLVERSAYGSRAPSFASHGSRCTQLQSTRRTASLARVEVSVANIHGAQRGHDGAIASMNSGALKPALASVNALRRPLVSTRRLVTPSAEVQAASYHNFGIVCPVVVV